MGTHFEAPGALAWHSWILRIEFDFISVQVWKALIEEMNQFSFMLLTQTPCLPHPYHRRRYCQSDVWARRQIGLDDCIFSCECAINSNLKITIKQQKLKTNDLPEGNQAEEDLEPSAEYLLDVRPVDV